ncbi:MAG: stage II sporulation protein M [Acidobacteria bacterium]|nr:stage II sporulation protein M [Acidobacteriota bacterium]
MRSIFSGTAERDQWQRLEDLLELMKISGLRGLSRVEVREFGELYRRAAADLAIARAETRDPALVGYLNGLVIRAHGHVYRAESGGIGQLRLFFGRELPETFRRNWKFLAFAFIIFAGAAVFGFITTWIDSDFTHFVALSGITDEIRSGHRWWLRLNEANQVGATEIMSNNILVMARAFALGAFFGVGAIYVLAFEGARLGSIFGAGYKIDPAFANDLASFVVGHGVIELSCIFFCAGAGMMIGYSLIAPGDLTRAQAAKKSGMDAARIVIGCACFLVVAGTIEGFLSPSALPAAVKVATGVLTGIALYSYLFFVGRSAGDETVGLAQQVSGEGSATGSKTR